MICDDGLVAGVGVELDLDRLGQLVAGGLPLVERRLGGLGVVGAVVAEALGGARDARRDDGPWRPVRVPS